MEKKMFKRTVTFAILIFIDTLIFSQTITQLSIGFEDSNSFEKNANHDSLFIPSLGVDLTDYTFFNGNFGAFIHTVFIFPVSRGFQIYDNSVMASALIGPAYKLPIDSNFEIVFGLGFSVSGMFYRYSRDTQSSGRIKYERNEVNLGIGGDIQVKWFLYRSLYINIGSILSWDFSNYSSVISRYGDYARFTEKYSMFSLNPYLGIGLQFPFERR
jgi:hypothetical protein